ncbi:hypothetical protein ABTE24_19870, partial [Acinetobacter baumannii]
LIFEGFAAPDVVLEIDEERGNARTHAEGSGDAAMRLGCGFCYQDGPKQVIAVKCRVARLSDGRCSMHMLSAMPVAMRCNLPTLI